MKIHFIIPSNAEKGRQEVLDRIYGCNFGFFTQHNVFILEPATVLKNLGYEIEISDCVVEKKSLNEVLKLGGDVFVFYSVFLSRDIDLWASKEIKKRFGKKWIIFLGNDPVWFIDKYLISDNHIVIRGEPEETIVEVLNELGKNKPLLKNIKGISWRKNGKKIDNPLRKYISSIDKLPIPDRLLLKKPFAYPNARFAQFPSTTMLTSRGCAYRCLFCFPNSLSFAREIDWKNIHKIKPPVKVKSAQNVIKEFETIYEQGFRSVSIVDDQFLWERRRTEKILKGIKKFKMEIAILARCDRLIDFALVKMMAEAGIKHIAFGVESFHQPILDYIRKDLKVSTITQAIRWCKKAGIKPEINIILGSCPLETKETIAHTINEVEKLKVDIVHVNVITPFPGTDYAKLAKEKGWMTTEEYQPIDSSAQSLISYPHLSDKELIKAVKGFILRHYFSPGYIWRNINNVKSLGEFMNKIKAGINEFKLLLIR